MIKSNFHATKDQKLDEKVDSALSEMLKYAKDINEYDFKKMIEDFTLEEIRNKNKISKLKEFKEKNRKWKEKTEAMKQFREEEKIKRRNELNLNLEEKNKKIEYKKIEKEMKNKNEFLEHQFKSQEAVSNFQTKMKNHYEIQESTRLEYERKLHEKFNNSSQNFFEFQHKKKQAISDKLSQSSQNFYKNSQMLYLKNLEKLDEEEEKRFKQFEKRHKHFEVLKLQKRKKKLNHLEKLEKQEEIQRNLLLKREKQGEEIMDNLKHVEENKNRLLEEKSLKLKEKGETLMIKTQRFFNRKLELDQEREDTKLKMLEKQINLINNSTEIDDNLEYRRKIVQEQNILKQLTIHKKMNLFQTQLDFFKEQSVQRKSPYDKRKIFNRLKREEKERKLKEDEENQKKQNRG